MLMRAYLARWSVFGFSAVAALAACSDESPSISAPQERIEAINTSLSALGGIPTGRTVVVFKDTAAIPASGISLINSLGGTVVNRWDNVGVAFVTGLSLASLSSLRANDLISAVGNDRYINWLPRVQVTAVQATDALAVPQNDPAKASYYANGTQWNMKQIGANKAWAAGKQGLPSTRVAILDTGIDYGHREIRTLVDLAASESFTNATYAGGSVEGVSLPSVEVPIDPQAPGDSAFMDNHFHGTHVASTVASNNISVASIAPDVTLIAVKVLNWQGTGSFEGVAGGILYAAEVANADVINMSLGANIDGSDPEAQALLEMMARTIKEAERQGTLVVSAAGNSALNLDEGSLVSTPCEQSHVCVSATGPLLQQNFDQPATYTNFGITAIEVAAPGGNATDTEGEYQTQDLIIGACSRRTSEAGLAVCRGNVDGGVYFYAYAAGTSMASPHVAAMAALIKSYNPTLSAGGLRSKVLGATDDIGVKGRDAYSNYGRINVAKALGLK